MKKLLAVILCMICCLTIFTGCNAEKNDYVGKYYLYSVEEKGDDIIYVETSRKTFNKDDCIVDIKEDGWIEMTFFDDEWEPRLYHYNQYYNEIEISGYSYIYIYYYGDYIDLRISDYDVSYSLILKKDI